MQVKTIAFELKIVGETILELDDFLGHLDKHKQEDWFYRTQRELHFNSSSTTDFLPGLFLTIRNQTKLAQYRDGKFTVLSLKDLNKVLDWNFFLLHRGTHRGLYQQYSSSCKIGTFGRYLSKRFRDWQEVRFEEDPDGSRDDYSGDVELNQLALEKDMRKFMRRVDRVSSATLGYTTLEHMDRDFRSSDGVAKRVTHKVSFSADAATGKIARFLSRLIGKTDPVAGTIQGRTEEGDPVVFRLYDENPTILHRDSSDEILASITLGAIDRSNFARSKPMVRLRKIASANLDILETEAE